MNNRSPTLGGRAFKKRMWWNKPAQTPKGIPLPFGELTTELTTRTGTQSTASQRGSAGITSCSVGVIPGSFWFGIAGPDLTPIHHRGQVDLYFDETGDEEDYQLLVAQFDDGDLLHVNGVEPE